MNSATRLYTIFSSFNSINRAESTFNRYKKVFNVSSVFDVHKAMLLMDREATTLEKIFIHSNKIGKYKSLIDHIRTFTQATNLDISSLTFEPILLGKLDVLSDSLEYKQFEEQDVSDQLETLKDSIESFIASIESLDIDREDKLIYMNVTTELLKSIQFYKISGIGAINSPLKIFECITKDNQEANLISNKFKKIVKVSKDLTGLIGLGGKLLEL